MSVIRRNFGPTSVSDAEAGYPYWIGNISKRHQRRISHTSNPLRTVARMEWSGIRDSGYTTADTPPSILIAVPVIKPAWSDTRKATSAPTSSGWPSRFTGTFLAIFS